MAGTIDARCTCERCESRTKEIYTLTASCINCGAGPFEVTFRKGDVAYRVIMGTACPNCGCESCVCCIARQIHFIV